ncbi:MAG: type II toxin-antitoxin system RelE/ParE family toxin [Solobacterium sp.]|nr:type II toxin-antitoxin system RelE/ParE family toxin [Solobacterium sp.]
MKKYEVIIAEQAEQDLRGIYEYIVQELLSPENAVGQLNRLEAAINKLNTFPESHRLYEEEPWHSRNLRVFPVDSFLIFYIPDNTEMTVTIIRVIYEGKNIKEQLNRFTKYME